MNKRFQLKSRIGFIIFGPGILVLAILLTSLTFRADTANLSVSRYDDVRSKNLNHFDFSKSPALPPTLTYNKETIWPGPQKLPSGFDPDELMTEAMNPGLGIRDLHQQGITGKGVNVAIIDQPLLQDHPEYNGKIAAYYDTGCNGSASSMHGPAVASLLVGKNCGTAPDARVYYVAAPSWKADAAYYAKGLQWIIEQNENLPASQKIRVVSVSAAPSGPGSPFTQNNERWDTACALAESKGILVLDCTSHRGKIFSCYYDLGQPDNRAGCTPGFSGQPPYYNDQKIHAPSSRRTTAQHYDYQGRNSYIYWGRGGLSWSIPYCAGVLALGWQVRPELSSEELLDVLFQTAYIHSSGAKIINPKEFIREVRLYSGTPTPSQIPLRPVRKSDE